MTRKELKISDRVRGQKRFADAGLWN
jgi:hypothetical protein